MHVAGSYSVPLPADITGKELGDNGTLTLAQIYDEKAISNEALATTNKIIAPAVHPRCMGMAAWMQYSPDDLSGVQTSFFTDLLANFSFRLIIYYMSNLQQYHMVLLRKIWVHAD